MKPLLAVAATLLAALIGGGHVAAQQQGGTGIAPLDRGSVISPVLTIDSERVFLESAFGKRVAQEAEAKGKALGAENREIEAALETEERELTERRTTMEPDAFRALADAFDRKVQETRAAQTAKSQAINEALDAERKVFLEAAAPILERLMRESGAAVILERRSVFVSASAVDITEDAIALLDETLGNGQ